MKKHFEPKETDSKEELKEKNLLFEEEVITK